MKISTRLFGLTLYCVVTASQAESWQDIHSTFSGFFQLDQDSVLASGEGLYTARWRTGSSLKQPYFIERATVDCKQESLELSTSSYIQTDPIMVKLDGAETITDYVAGKRQSGRYTTDLSDADLLRRYRYPISSSADGQLIRQVCQQNYFPESKREEYAIAFQKRLGCNSNPKAASPLCAKDSDTLETLYSFAFRLMQIKEACPVSQEQLDSVANNWLDKVFECSNCDLSGLRWSISSLGDDLARVANKQSCSYLSIAIEQVSKDKEQAEATTRFRACLKRTIPAIDDLISSADVVASAVFAACRSELTPFLAKNKVFEERVLPGVTALVLKHRQIARQRPTKSAPKRKAVQS